MSDHRQHLKTGHFYCEAVLEHRRESPCQFCGRAAPSDPHHFPPKGAGNRLTDDLKTIPVCRECHRRCGGDRIQTAFGLKPPISKDAQYVAVGNAIHDFLFNATRERIDAFADALMEHRSKRGI